MSSRGGTDQLTFYARFDGTAPAPAPVTNWYDTGFADYPNLPPASDLIEMTAAEWAVRMNGAWAVTDGKLLAFTPPPGPVLPWMVPKLVVVTRLGAIGKLRDARAALKMGVADSALSDAALLLRDRWTAAVEIASDDPDVKALLGAVGCDATAILARP